jgi:hypothetical protein
VVVVAAVAGREEVGSLDDDGNAATCVLAGLPAGTATVHEPPSIPEVGVKSKVDLSVAATEPGGRPSGSLAVTEAKFR